MDSFQKRDRERKKRLKRMEKEARRKERSQLVHQHRTEPATAPASTDVEPLRAADGSVKSPGAPEELP